jgi:hypothetical protein
VLRWFTQNIDSVYIDGQPTIGESSQQVCPLTTTTYVLLVLFRDGSQQTYSLTVQVEDDEYADIGRTCLWQPDMRTGKLRSCQTL